MQPIDQRLRDDLSVVAHDAGPLRLEGHSVVAKVRGRRRRRVLGVAVGTILVASGLVAGIDLARGNSNGHPPTPAASPSSPRPFVCGDQWALGNDARSTSSGLTMTLSTVRKTADDVGPTLAVTFTADRTVAVHGSPASLFEVLYLHHGVILGGGPMLNQPGDLTAQGMDLVGAGFDVDPGHPNTQDLGPRDGLCPGLTWRQIWSDPGGYEVLLVQGPVQPMPDNGSDELLLDIPTLGYGPLLVARADLRP